MDISYSIDNVNNMIKIIEGTGWAGNDLRNMVEIGYIITHGDFSDDNLIGKFAPYYLCEFCTIPSRYINYSMGDRLGDNNEDIVQYFRVALEFITNYIKKFWREILQNLNKGSWRNTWMRREFIRFMEENRDKYPEQYLELKLS